MDKQFSPAWKSSSKPNKQRKYRHNAPLHVKGKFMNAHLSKELRAKYNMRAVRVRVGDKVRIMRGQYKKLEGKVERVDISKLKIYVSKAEIVKRDGSKSTYPIDPSNVLIVELHLDDKHRLTKAVAPVAKPKVAKAPVEKKTVAKTEKTAEKKAKAPVKKSQ